MPQLQENFSHKMGKTANLHRGCWHEVHHRLICTTRSSFATTNWCELFEGFHYKRNYSLSEAGLHVCVKDTIRWTKGLWSAFIRPLTRVSRPGAHPAEKPTRNIVVSGLVSPQATTIRGHKQVALFWRRTAGSSVTRPFSKSYAKLRMLTVFHIALLHQPMPLTAITLRDKHVHTIRIRPSIFKVRYNAKPYRSIGRQHSLYANRFPRQSFQLHETNSQKAET